MADNFYDTAQRMGRSSKILHSSSEYHNACYFAGYVIECYAKIIVSLEGGNARTFGHNLDRLNIQLQYLLSDHSAVSSFISDLMRECPNICAHWHPNKRYEPESTQWTSLNSNLFQKEILFAMTSLANMKINYTILP